jgi:hypothetical protein
LKKTEFCVNNCNKGSDFWVLSKETQLRRASEKRGQFLGWAQTIPENSNDKLYSLLGSLVFVFCV